ncbi:hypothetical protein, partial [Enterobacter hormaechei]|uniref:hypothetical protein n=1 Tax=Enterobacter hormaechei TaxID=158836 RepID=UPI002FF38318
FITVSVGMVLANRCHRQNMKTSIINGSEVSRLSVAIQFSILPVMVKMGLPTGFGSSPAQLKLCTKKQHSIRIIRILASSF